MLLEEIKKIVLNELDETIKKRGNKYCLLSKKTKRNLGCYSSKKGAKNREKQVQYFKHMKEMSASGAGSVAGVGAPLIDKEEN